MITAPLAAGYTPGSTYGWRAPVMAAAGVGAVFPNRDLVAFYLIDNRALHLHRYWVQAPAFAVGASALLYAATTWIAPRLRPIVLAFGAAWIMHLLLDPMAGDIMWAWPFSTEGFALLQIPGRPGTHWIVAFLTHWSILFEAAIWVAAFAKWRHRRPQ